MKAALSPAGKRSALLIAAVLVFALSGCGSNLGRLYPEASDASGKKPLSERIAEWENFKLPGLRGDDDAPDATAGGSGAEDALPEGSDSSLTEEEAALAAEEEAAAAERQAQRYRETVAAVTGEWAELSEALPLFRPIVSWYGPLVIREDGTYSSDTGTGTWTLSEDLTSLTLQGSRGKTLVQILDDGGYRKLCAPELHLNFLQSEELDAYIAERFVIVALNDQNVGDYIARPQNIGVILDEKDKPTSESAWLLASLAYDDGLVYYGRSEDFRLTVSSYSEEGGSRSAILPYDTLSLRNGASFGAITHAEGTLVFLRAEFVTDNRMTDARTRSLTLLDGTTHTTSMTWYSDLADYADWVF